MHLSLRGDLQSRRLTAAVQLVAASRTEASWRLEEQNLRLGSVEYSTVQHLSTSRTPTSEIFSVQYCTVKEALLLCGKASAHCRTVGSMAAAVENFLPLAGLLLLLLSTATLTVRAESALSKVCRAELVNLASATNLCSTCKTYFWILNQTCEYLRDRTMNVAACIIVPPSPSFISGIHTQVDSPASRQWHLIDGGMF